MLPLLLVYSYNFAQIWQHKMKFAQLCQPSPHHHSLSPSPNSSGVNVTTIYYEWQTFHLDFGFHFGFNVGWDGMKRYKIYNTFIYWCEQKSLTCCNIFVGVTKDGQNLIPPTQLRPDYPRGYSSEYNNHRQQHWKSQEDMLTPSSQFKIPSHWESSPKRGRSILDQGCQAVTILCLGNHPTPTTTLKEYEW